ncbi:MAG: hypothetical protein GY715_09645 [Planctomycetes bacterium]|nr:hypothetical protein [Planctomycetota bacterium]
MKARRHQGTKARRGWWCGAVAVMGAVCAASAASDEFVLIDSALDVHEVRVVEINDLKLAYQDAEGTLQTSLLDESIALIRQLPDAVVRRGGAGPLPLPVPTPVATSSGPSGWLQLADGQRLPGSLAGTAPDVEDVLGWSHAWIGRIDVPLDAITSVTFGARVMAPAPGRMDVVVLANGDRVEGYVKSLTDPIRILVDLEAEPREVTIPLARAASVVLVTSPHSPSGRRIWFQDGTLVDARRFRVADDGYVRISTDWSSPGTPPVEVPLDDVVGILFDPQALLPLGRVDPARVEAIGPRYVVPAPRRLDERAPLGLGRIVFDGPVMVRYALPPGCQRFAAEGSLPESSRVWGDYDLVVRDDDREVHRARINAEHPTAAINVPLTGTELTIEITAGDHGPIQDRLVLKRAMLLVGE